MTSPEVGIYPDIRTKRILEKTLGIRLPAITEFTESLVYIFLCRISLVTRSLNRQCTSFQHVHALQSAATLFELLEWIRGWSSSDSYPNPENGFAPFHFVYL